LAFAFGDETYTKTTLQACINLGDRDNASFVFGKEMEITHVLRLENI
jgi:hypothetical protein